MADMFRIAERASLTETIGKIRKADAYSIASQDSKEPRSFNTEDLLDFSSGDFLKSIVLSEVLGKPKSMRKARW